MAIARKYEWSKLNHLQSGKFAEYYTKMEFTLLGFDVYSTEVDDKGIDFVIKNGMKYYDIQVKSIRGNNYIFFPRVSLSQGKIYMQQLLYFLKGKSHQFILYHLLFGMKQTNYLLVEIMRVKKVNQNGELIFQKKININLKTIHFMKSQIDYKIH